MPLCQSIGSSVRSYIKANERLCLICNESLDTIHSLKDLSVFPSFLCTSCRSKLKLHQKIYIIDGLQWHVLYEYDEFLERLFFRYKEQCDILLAPVFLETIRDSIDRFQKFTVCTLCSSNEKYMHRGFDPLKEIFLSWNIPSQSPFYKRWDHKQSQLSKDQRQQVFKVLRKKEHHFLNSKNILLADDVCTTGSTLRAAVSLVLPQYVFVLSAHPLWIEDHRQMVVEKKGLFW